MDVQQGLGCGSVKWENRTRAVLRRVVHGIASFNDTQGVVASFLYLSKAGGTLLHFQGNNNFLLSFKQAWFI